MAITDADVAQLEAALASGERVIQTRDRRIEYRSIDEIKAAIAEAKTALAQEAVTPKVLRGFTSLRSGL